MAKKKTAKKRATTKPAKATTKRSATIATTDFGIDLDAIVQEIKPHLVGKTQKQIADKLDTSAMVVSHWMTGNRTPSLGALAALADASGGRLVVRYEPPKKRSKQK